MTQTLSATTEKPAAVGAGLKWAVMGGLAAVTALGGVWVIQNTGKTIQGGGGGAMVSAAPQNVRPTDLETALAKPNTRPPVTEPIQVPTPEPIAAPAPMPVMPVKPAPLKAKASPHKVDPAKVELAAWEAAQAGGTPAAYQHYLKTYPAGTFNGLARNRLTKLGEPQAWQEAEQANSREAYDRFLQAYPNSAYAALAKARLARLNSSTMKVGAGGTA